MLANVLTFTFRLSQATTPDARLIPRRSPDAPARTMHPGALRALEFDQIVEAVRSLALTPLGDARLADTEPQTDLHQSSIGPDLETVISGRNPPFALQGLRSRGGAVSLAIEGRALEPLRAAGARKFSRVGRLTCAAVRNAGGSFPLLKALVDVSGTFTNQIAEVRRQIDPSGGWWIRRPQRGHPRAHAEAKARLRSTSSHTCAGRTPRVTCRNRW